MSINKLCTLSRVIAGRHGVNLTRVGRQCIEVDLEVGGTNRAIQLNLLSHLLVLQSLGLV